MHSIGSLEVLSPIVVMYFTRVRGPLWFGAALLTAGLAWVTLSLGPGAPPPWMITHRVAAHRALVVDVEARHPEDALAIARAIAEPEQLRFDEILVFIYRPGDRTMLRRVQWTREHGFVEDVY